MRVSVVLASGVPEEMRLAEALAVLRERYDLARFERTTKVRIERGVIPYSHPVLTLSERCGPDDEHLLSGYLHAQLHWWSMECPGALDGRDEPLYDDLDGRFPLPLEPPEGCGDRLSNLIHMHVCWLELEAMAFLVCSDRAISVLTSLPYYTSVYRTVIAHRDELRERFTEAGMGPPSGWAVRRSRPRHDTPCLS